MLVVGVISTPERVSCISGGVRGELVISKCLLIQSHIVIVISSQSVDIFEYIAIVNYKVLYVFAVAIYIVVKTLIGRSREAVKT